MRYNKILRELIFAQNCAKCCYFAQKCYKTEAKVCVPFRKTCAKVLRTKTLILRTKIKGSAIKTIMIKYAKKYVTVDRMGSMEHAQEHIAYLELCLRSLFCGLRCIHLCIQYRS